MSAASSLLNCIGARRSDLRCKRAVICGFSGGIRRDSGCALAKATHYNRSRFKNRVTSYKNASATESARTLPLRVSRRLSFDFRSNLSVMSSSIFWEKSFSSEAEIPSRVRNPSAIRSVRHRSGCAWKFGRKQRRTSTTKLSGSCWLTCICIPARTI